MPFTYQFKKGEKTKLNLFELHGRYELRAWTRLLVQKVDGDNITVRMLEAPYKEITVPYSELEKPLGFQPVYHIVVGEKEEAETTLSWFKTRGGITVWTSHDLGSAGRFMYTPADNGVENKPHWSMGLVEIVTNAERIKLFIETLYNAKGKPKEKGDWKYDKRQRVWYKTDPYVALQDAGK